MKLLVGALIAAFVACGLGVLWPPLLPFALAMAGVVFGVYLATVLIRASKRR